MITFETVSGSAPIEGTEITNQFQVSHGVTFSLRRYDGTGTAPVISEYGGPAWAFYGPPTHLGPDMPAAG